METITIKQIANIIKKSDTKKDMEKAENLAGKYLRGASRPSFDNILLLEKKLSIPFTAWKDIKSFLSETIQKDGNKN